MAGEPYTFDGIRVGDYVCFDRTFTERDFQAFSALSGDMNALHHDPDYAAARGYAGPIVPLHLALSPLSAIAGMGLPGEPSLYLSHSAHATLPIFYGDTITYSARVRSINVSRRTLGLSVLGIRGLDVVLEAEMTVQSRDATWRTAPGLPIRSAHRPHCAVITGASGKIAAATTRLLLQRGWQLILQTRPSQAGLLQQAYEGSSQVRIVDADLSTSNGRDKLVQVVEASDTDCLVHTASPPVDAALESHIAVTYQALAELSRAAAPYMLRQQEGVVIFVGSAAVEMTPKGWDHYVAAKTMAQSAVNSFNSRYTRFGCRAATIAPGYVESGFSEGLRPAGADTLMPEEVADAIVQNMLGDSLDTYISVRPGGALSGSFQPLSRTAAKTVAMSKAARTPQEDSGAPQAEPSQRPLAAADGLDEIFRSVLKLRADFPLEDARVDATPGWDSLRHIQLILEVERSLGITILSQEIDATTSYAELSSLCRRKLGLS